MSRTVASIELARKVLRTEAAAILGLVDRMDAAPHHFERAVQLLYDCRGRVIVTGMGKSGLICRKIAATLSSTGTSAWFLHPAEALHGDLGAIREDDVVIALSYSGETEELLRLLESIRRLGARLIALTGDPSSSMARAADVTLDCSIAEEACPMNLAPTASTTAALAMGDALAVAVFRRKGFRAEDFAQLHPGGALGRKLSLRVEDVMVGTDFPSLPEGARMMEAVKPIAKLRGTVPVVDGGGRVVGVVTAGDLTRLMERDEKWAACPVAEVMTRNPKTVAIGELASGAVHRMEESRIMALPVVDERGVLRGVLHLHDLLRSGAV